MPCWRSRDIWGTTCTRKAHDQRAQDYLWREVLWAIWGSASENSGGRVLKAAPEELKEKYRQVFA